MKITKMKQIDQDLTGEITLQSATERNNFPLIRY